MRSFSKILHKHKKECYEINDKDQNETNGKNLNQNTKNNEFQPHLIGVNVSSYVAVGLHSRGVDNG
jgi:hypothetical protein